MKTEELRVKMKAAFDNGYATAIADEAKLDKIRRNKAIDDCIWVCNQTFLSFYSNGLKPTSEEITKALEKLKV